MRSIQSLSTENQDPFGPGVDLIISLVAILMLIFTFAMQSYIKQLEQINDLTSTIEREKAKNDTLSISLFDISKELGDLKSQGGHFKVANDYFSAGHFKTNPVTDFTNEEQTRKLVEKIILEYRQLKHQFPFIFIIGHANYIEISSIEKRKYKSRAEANWVYAGRRAARIADLLTQHLTFEEKENVIILSTGEFDMKNPNDPTSEVNAWVEIVFGKEWKLPAASD